VNLTTDECPLVIGDLSEQYNIGRPIFLGAFATIPNANPTGDTTYINYNLAINEFTVDGKGIPAGQGSGTRTPLVIVCNDQLTQAGYDAAMNHLIGDLHAAAVVAPLASGYLKTTFTNDDLDNDAGQALVINPLLADSTITPPALATNGLLWHDLPSPASWAPAYAAFFPTVERYVRGLHNLAPTTPMKVAAVLSAQSTDLSDLSTAVLQVLTWNNGQTPTTAPWTPTNMQGTFDQEGLSNTVLNGVTAKSIDNTQVVSDLLAFRPDVILSFGSDEFVTMLENLELQWGNSVPRPFYLLSGYNTNYAPLITWIYTTCQNNYGGINLCRWRFAGINPASTSDTADLAAYDNRFLTFTMGQSQLLGGENFYDAMYLAVYSLVAAGRMYEPNALTASQGMLRLLSPSSMQYHEGPTDMGNIYGSLLSGSSIALYGPLGAPDFNLATGVRSGEGDVYCIGWSEAGAPQYNLDVLKLTAPEGGTLYAPEGGTPFCTPDGGF
jgi:hypothetical protein